MLFRNTHVTIHPSQLFGCINNIDGFDHCSLENRDNPFNAGQLPTFDLSLLEAGNAATFSDVAKMTTSYNMQSH